VDSPAWEWGSGLSTVGSKTSDGARDLPPLHVPGWVRYLDMVVLAIALPVFLLAGLPIAGYLVGGGAWVIQRIAQVLMQRRAEASNDPRVVAGWTAGSMIARGWFCALAIFGVGLAEGDEAGLSAGVLVIALFTVYFLVRMILRPLDMAAERRPT
jgi:hypothetical protein